jgi:hypothetical protein
MELGRKIAPNTLLLNAIGPLLFTSPSTPSIQRSDNTLVWFDSMNHFLLFRLGYRHVKMLSL